jgi:hypothetical protein
MLLAGAAAAVIVVSAGLAFQFLNGDTRHDVSGGAPAVAAATFVGSEVCAGCHQAQAQLWRASQHAHAMDHANNRSVLGDFNDASFDYYGVRSRFFRKDGKFFVETDGPDGKPASFEVKYTFGVDPLQQYLIEFPDGRLQALSLAWDSRPKEQDGQRWFHLYPSEDIKHDDVLHWTKLNQNWNFMCAGCHSTGVRKNYDAAKDRFATSFAEISVGCEACHGQGSRHVAWARARQSWWPFGKSDDPKMGLAVLFDERRDVVWRRDAETGNAQRNFTPALLRKEVETLRPVPCAKRRILRGLGSRPVAVRYPCGLAACPRALPRRRADAGRGLQLRLVQAEQNVRGRRHLQRLSRAARRQAARRGRRRLPAVPCRRQVRGGYAPPARGRNSAARLRVLPHAGAHLHGGRSPARSQLPCPASGSLGEARHSQCLQRLPH